MAYVRPGVTCLLVDASFRAERAAWSSPRSMESVSLPALPGAPPGSPEFREGAFHDLLGVIWGRWLTVSRACCPDTPAPARPAVPVGDGRAGAGMGWRDMVADGARYESPRWSVTPSCLRSGRYLRAFRGGCNYGGSGQVLRAALWYHSIRLRRHHAMLARRLLRLQFCVWVSAAISIPGDSHPGFIRLRVARLPVLGFGWRWPMGLHAWLQFWGAAGTYLLASHAGHHCGVMGR